jgi:RNA polymerase sigma-70 factor (sigma-E family)
MRLGSEEKAKGRLPVRFEDYVAEQGPSLLRLAYVLTRDAQLAEDLTQTVLADVFRHWRKVTAARHPDAYVRRMLVNAHLSWHRRRSSSERPSDLTANEPGVEADLAEGVVCRDQVRHLVATLAPRARTVLVLRYYADLDDAAIAEAMGVSASAVRATASRALETLRSGAVLDALEETR